MPIPDSCLRLMIFSMKMICSRFTAEWLENKLFFRKKWCFVSGKIFKVWERLGFWYFAHEKSRGVGRFVQMRCFAPRWSRWVARATHFEMYLLAIRPFDSALLEGGTPLYRPYRYFQPQRVWEICVYFGNFRLKLLRYGFFTLVLN